MDSSTLKKTQGDVPRGKDELKKKKVVIDASEIARKEIERLKALNMKFSGVAFAFIYRPHNGFADYANVKLKIKDGVIVEVEEVSDPYTSIEALARMEIKLHRFLEDMHRKYPAGYQSV